MQLRGPWKWGAHSLSSYILATPEWLLTLFRIICWSLPLWTYTDACSNLNRKRKGYFHIYLIVIFLSLLTELHWLSTNLDKFLLWMHTADRSSIGQSNTCLVLNQWQSVLVFGIIITTRASPNPPPQKKKTRTSSSHYSSCATLRGHLSNSQALVWPTLKTTLYFCEVSEWLDDSAFWQCCILTAMRGMRTDWSQSHFTPTSYINHVYCAVCRITRSASAIVVPLVHCENKVR